MNVLTRAHALGIAAGASRVPTTCQAPWGARYLCDPVWSQRHLSSVRSIRITTSVAISQMRTVKFPRGRGNRGQSRDSGKVSDPSSGLLSRKHDPGEGRRRGPWSKGDADPFHST